MSGGGDTTQVNSVPDWVRPYAETYMGRAQQVADIPYQSYSGQTVAQMNPYQTQAYQAQAARGLQGSPLTGAASQELQRTLNGDYLSQGNPYLSGVIDKASQDAIRNYQTAVIPQLDMMDARSGSFGNSGVNNARAQAAQSLGKTISDTAFNTRYQDYSAERGRQQSAVGMAPSVANQDYTDLQAAQEAGSALQGQEQKNLTDQYQRWQQAQDAPKQSLATLGQGLGFNFGNTSRLNSSSNPWAQAAGTGLAAYGAYNSGGGK